MNHLAKYLARTGKKPAHLAFDLGVRPSTITRIISGERRPSPELAKRISDATGVDVMDLLYPPGGEAA